MVTLSHYLILAALLFSISIAGIVINRKNIIILLMSIELMLLSVNLNFIAFSHYLDDLAGQVFVFSFSPLPPPRRPSGLPYWWCCSVTSARSTSKISRS